MKFKITKSTIILVLICYVVLLTVLSLVNFPEDRKTIDIENLDKVKHIIFYFGLNSLLLIMVHLYSRSAKMWQIICVTLSTIIYGFIIEIIQQNIGREFDMGDIVANVVGVALSLVIYYLITPKNK